MIKIMNIDTYGWESAVRGVRNPYSSWAKSDSQFDTYVHQIGTADLKLMQKLANAGNDHGKFLRMITVTMDIDAPLYWWKEMDTYKVGTVADSCSTMHTLHTRDLKLDDFSHEHLREWEKTYLRSTIAVLNTERAEYMSAKTDEGKKEAWWQMIQLLPSSFNQMRTWQANYAVLRNIYHARKDHKLDEWKTFCSTIELLPYAKELIIGGDAKNG